MNSLLAQQSDAKNYPGLGQEEIETALQQLKDISARKYRLGGGKEEPDGSYSYLFRYLGSPGEAGGELYLRKNEANVWQIDDLFIEPLTTPPEERTYGISPYVRFY
jgi:hypothetical protein